MRIIRRAAVWFLLMMMLVSCAGPGNRAEEPDAGPEEQMEIEPEEPAVTLTVPEEPPQIEDEGEEEPPEEDEEEDPAAEEPTPIAATTPSGSYGDYSEEAYEQLVADVLDSITTSDMTKLQKAKAIFDYAKGKIRYTGTSDKSDWKQGAYTGMTAKAGDCFTYYAVSRALLTAAGIDNLEVTRLGGPTSHYWNLVNCGDGWYHFDATPRSSKMPAFDSFMFTDAEAADYTARAGRSYYSFDGSLYPARAGSEDTSTPAAPVEEPVSENTVPAAEDAVPAVEETVPAAEDTEPAAEDDAPAAGDTGGEGDVEPSAEPEPVLPENEIPLDAIGLEPEPEPDAPEEVPMPAWLMPVDPADDDV